MNSSRVVAGIAALAIGFGVTLAGVALSDDDVASIEPTVTTVVDEGATDQQRDDGDGSDGAELEDDGSEAEQDDGDSAEEVNGDDAPGEAQPPGEVSDPDEPVDEDPLPTGTVELPPPETDPDVAVLEEVRCVETISVVFDDGFVGDFVVLERQGTLAWLVLDVDGAFVITLDDFDVDRVIEVERNVVFFQEAPIEFLDVCDDLSATPRDPGLDLGSFAPLDGNIGGEPSEESCAPDKICTEAELNGNH